MARSRRSTTTGRFTKRGAARTSARKGRSARVRGSARGKRSSAGWLHVAGA